MQTVKNGLQSPMGKTLSSRSTQSTTTALFFVGFLFIFRVTVRGSINLGGRLLK